MNTDTVTTAPVPYARLPFAFDTGISSRAAIGLIVLATDHTIEYEWRNMLDIDGVAFYESRIESPIDITPVLLAEMDERIAPSVRLIRPGEHLDVVAFGCTSGAMVIGEEQVFARIREARPDIAATTPITGALAACRALDVKRIALLTPYVREINDWMGAYIAERGVAVVRIGSFEHQNDNEVARIDGASLRAAVLALGEDPNVDAVFVSCTSLRLAAQIPALEAAIGKPVLSSNYAMAWHALRLAGVDDVLPALGRLFTV
jgi:maleate isomerase